MARKPVAISKNGKWDSPTLTRMRDVAFGAKAMCDIRDVTFHSETMRNDEQLLSDAEKKRIRKQEKRAALCVKV